MSVDSDTRWRDCRTKATPVGSKPWRGIMRAQNTQPSSSPLHRLRCRLAAEQGMSLILVLGFLTIFTITTAAIVNELVLNESGARHEQTMVTALAAAEAELNFAQQWVSAND